MAARALDAGQNVSLNSVSVLPSNQAQLLAREGDMFVDSDRQSLRADDNHEESGLDRQSIDARFGLGLAARIVHEHDEVALGPLV